MIDIDTLDLLAGLPSWFADAACHGMTDPDVMFDGPVSEAKAVCARCDVRQPCADYAATEGIVWGTWGGLSEDDRQQARTAARAA